MMVSMNVLMGKRVIYNTCICTGSASFIILRLQPRSEFRVWGQWYQGILLPGDMYGLTEKNSNSEHKSLTY